MIRFDHFNFNVLDLDRSIQFYEKALDLHPAREYEDAEKTFKLVYMGDDVTGFTLELTYLRDRKEPYNLGEKEFHLAFVTDRFQEYHDRHQEMGIICFENPTMGIYFIEDPDGYWIEVVPDKK